jgi:L-amino acid N-acyltransferase YncA
VTNSRPCRCEPWIGWKDRLRRVSPIPDRACYSDIDEFLVYVRRDYRRRGGGRAVLAARIEAATAAGLHKLTSRVFPEDAVTRPFEGALTEIGIHHRHGRLDGRWRDCVIVERLLDMPSAQDQ